MRNRTKTSGIRLAALALAAVLAGCGLTPAPFEQPSQKQEEPAAKPQVTQPTEQPDATVPEDGGLVNMMTEDMVASDGYWGYDLPEYNTEEYGEVEETGFVSTATSPLSTVSADVDTASYANLRRMLVEGYRVAGEEDQRVTPTGDGDDDLELLEDMPYEWYYPQEDVIPTGAVRIEEMLNYFDYEYATPEGDDGFAITAKLGACPWNENTNLLVLGFATAPEDESVAQKGSNLVFLIDVSGSMDEPNKLPLLQNAFGELVDELDENDVVSIVTYSGEEEVVLEGESGANHRKILRAINSLEADGSTNGEAGLRMAYDIAEDNFIEGGVNRIVMASDGDLNVGMTSESDLHDFVEKKRDTGIYLSVLGFGTGNYKDTKMETLADHGNGSYHYIDSSLEAKRVFGERLTANLVPFANDVKVQVEFNPAQVKGYRLIGYENRTMAAEDFEDDEKDAGEVGPESQFTVVYEVVPQSSALEIPVPELKYSQPAATDAGSDLLTAKLRYQPIDGTDVVEQELAVTADDLLDDPGADWRFAAAVTEFGMILRDSEYKGSSTYDSVRALVDKTDDELRLEFLDLVDLAEIN